MRLLTGIFLFTICCINYTTIQAQNGNTYAHFDAGIAGTLTQPHTGLVAEPRASLSMVNLTYNQTPFVNHIIEVQAIRILGLEPNNQKYGRLYANSYVAASFRSQLQLGELLDYEGNSFNNTIKNLYASVGAGVISNHMIKINRQASAAGDTYPGKDNGTDFFIPIKIGYEFKIFNYWNGPSVKFDAGYQYNLMMGDDLDGYTTPNHKDAFSQVVLAIKFAIGGYTEYRKPIENK